MAKRPGIVLPLVLTSLLPQTFLLTVERSAVFLPAASRIAFISSRVVDFPFVPVTPITKIRRLGCRYTHAPKKAIQRWYMFLTAFCIMLILEQTNPRASQAPSEPISADLQDL